MTTNLFLAVRSWWVNRCLCTRVRIILIGIFCDYQDFPLQIAYVIYFLGDESHVSAVRSLWVSISMVTGIANL